MKIGFIPLDDRPPCYRFPVELGRIGGITVETPEPSLLGKTEKLADWAKTNFASWEGLIFSVDMIAYGGLVPSRELGINFEEARARLDSFLETVAPVKKGFIWAFSTVLKCFAKEKVKLRKRNHRLNLAALQLLKENRLDFLVTGLDDCTPFCSTSYEAAALIMEARRLKLKDRHYVSPGADELASLLVCRAGCLGKDCQLQVVFYPAGGKKIIPKYEDRPLAELVKLQTAIAGAVIAKSSPQVKLLINAPREKQKEAKNQRPKQKDRQPIISGLKRALSQGIPVGIADLHYANGADKALVTLLQENQLWNRISAYAAWNTAGNALGTTIAFLILSLRGKKKRIPKLYRLQFLLERFLDDWYYQAHLRGKVQQKYQTPAEALPEIKSQLLKQAKKLFETLPANYLFEGIEVSFPWDRFFEIELKAKLSRR